MGGKLSRASLGVECVCWDPRDANQNAHGVVQEVPRSRPRSAPSERRAKARAAKERDRDREHLVCELHSGFVKSWPDDVNAER